MEVDEGKEPGSECTIVAISKGLAIEVANDSTSNLCLNYYDRVSSTKTIPILISDVTSI